MLFEGRAEKRVQLCVALRLVGKGKSRPPEEVITENVSNRGVRVVAGQRWDSEELEAITMQGEFRAPVRLVYCQKESQGRFRLGIQILTNAAAWWSASGGA